MKHLLMIALLASMFSGSVFALGETEDFECPFLAESNTRTTADEKVKEIEIKVKQGSHSTVRM